MNTQNYLPQVPQLPRLDPRTGRLIPAPVRRPRLLAGPAPQIPAEWMSAPAPAPTPQFSEEQLAYIEQSLDQARPTIQGVLEGALLIAAAIGFAGGYFTGKGK